MIKQPADTHIDDLASPQFPDWVGDIIDSASATSVELSVDAVLTAARAAANGLDNFGDDEVRERLGVILAAMEEDGDLSPMGRATNFGICVRYAAQRARFEELFRQHPEIDDVEIRRPIIIAGLPRSGTTHMLNLISVDDRLRSLPYWESLEPFPITGEPTGAEDPRIGRCRDMLAIQDQILPLFKNMHDMYPEHIHEEIELMGMDFSMMLFENYALLPRWRDYYLAHDQTPHYRFLRRALKALQWLRGPDRWIMKSPQHIEQLPVLSTVFPDATVVLTHRDPVSVTTSLMTMIAYTGRMTRNPVRPPAIGAYWADRVERMLRACVADREQLPARQSMDVLFDDFMADDVTTIEHIYTLADHPMTPAVRKAMERYMTDNPRGKHGRIVYDLKGDFSLDPDALYERLRFYTDRFGVRLER